MSKTKPAPRILAVVSTHTVGFKLALLLGQSNPGLKISVGLGHCSNTKTLYVGECTGASKALKEARDAFLYEDPGVLFDLGQYVSPELVAGNTDLLRLLPNARTKGLDEA